MNINQFIIQITQKIPSNAILTFDLYNYKPKTILDERESITIQKDRLNKEELILIQKTAKEKNKELCITSKVLINNETFHIPMIDFHTKNIEEAKTLKNLSNNKFFILDSGNSYHGYFQQLISQQDWIKFMALLLLENNKKNDNNIVVDYRWIGHRLLGGFAALRISNNGTTYKKIPTISYISN